MNVSELLTALNIGEDQEIEFKLADGGLPKSIWETISAFANTQGGRIVLGVAQGPDVFTVVGIRKPDVLIKMFWDTHNSTQKINTSACKADDVYILPIQNQRVVVINVPPATRQQRPVFINGNPFTGTYKRNFEGDYRCSEAEVRQLLRDSSDDPFDGQILDGFDWDDLDTDTLSAYRNRFASRDPDHPFLAMSDRELLVRLGAWRKNRQSKQEGLTLAGILMFGKERSILEALPYFHLDYQEHLSDNPDVRWTFRLTLDGKWAPNLFNFYYRVYPRLVEDIDVPFELDKTSIRLAETHVHEALREALVNTLVHADHQSRQPISIIKHKKSFVFSNPGRLRIPRDQLYQGGISDPRNPSLLKMFQMLGLGEKAGSGFQKILRAWKEQHWLKPLVSENIQLEMTRVSLPILSLVPEEVEKELCSVIGKSAYQSMDEMGRTILMLAHRFGEIGNEDTQPYLDQHPRDIGIRLGQFSDSGWLTKNGHGRGTKYRWAGSDDIGLMSAAFSNIAHDHPSHSDSEHLDGRSEHLDGRSEHLDGRSEHLDGRSEHLPKKLQEELHTVASEVNIKGKVSKPLMEQTILSLCEIDWLTLQALASLLNRNSDSLRTHYINPMLKDGRLKSRVPGKPNHPHQAYRKSGIEILSPKNGPVE
jgi:ATP-dependent DNA helicase RecG